MFVLVVLLLASLESSVLGHIQEDDGHFQANLEPMWTTGIISDGVGTSSILVTDLNQDNVTDIVACSNGSVYVLNEATGGNYGTVNFGGYYDTIWYSEQISCGKMAVGDRDSNGVLEICVGTSNSSWAYELFQRMQPRHPTADILYKTRVWEQLTNNLNANSSPKVYIFRGDSFEEVDELSLPDNTGVTDIKVADVDNDGNEEIVVAQSNATLVYDANTLILEWQAIDKGGSELEIGDIDGDSELEIVVNGNPARVLNAILKNEEWAYSGGFGIDMAVGDVDGDNIAEIAYIESWDDAYVLDAEAPVTKWHLDNLSDLNAVTVADTDGDGVDEVLIGDGQWGNVTGYQGSDGTRLWRIPNPEHGVFGIGVGDTDNDGVNEVVWGGGLSSSGKDALFVGNWINQSVEWSSDDLDGPLHVAAGDVDNDGQVEIVVASFSTNSGYDGGTVRVYDGSTHQREWSVVVSNSYYDLYQVAIGQLDTDPALEIVVGADNWYDARLRVYDGITPTVEWESAELAGGAPAALLVMNLDTDPVEEIIVALSNNHVQVFNGASSVIQWDSGSLDGSVQDVDIGDLDGNSVLDMAVLTNQSVYIFEVGTWTQKLHQTLSDGKKLAIANGDLTGTGELLIVTSTGWDPTSSQLQAWDGASYELLWQRSIGNVIINDIATADLDIDGDEEFAIMGSTVSDWYSSGNPSLLLIGSQIVSSYWTEYQNNGYWGTINGMVFADVDNDSQMELVFGSSSLIHASEVISSPLVIRTTHLPIVVRSQ
ncbi:MAG: VCBS repeat-containing protein [Chloroflexota bacterium]|nr:VCBS repeat-containing protein [Chloroflexota bacterium]